MDKYYLWLIISEKDLNFFCEFFANTPKLFCECHQKDAKNKLINDLISNYYDEHCNNWKILNDKIILRHETCNKNIIASAHWEQIFFDEEFCEYLINLVFKANEIAKKIKDKPTQTGCLYREKEPEAVKATISSLMQKWNYDNEITIFTIVADLMYAFACRHKFLDGNKRTALILCSLFLQHCGLFLWKTNEEENAYMKFWEKLMINIVEKEEKEKNNIKKDENMIEYIKESIRENISISYQLFFN